MRDGNKKIIPKRGDVGGKGEVTRWNETRCREKNFNKRTGTIRRNKGWTGKRVGMHNSA